MDQATEPDENDNEIPHQTYDDESITQISKKDKKNTLEEKTQKPQKNPRIPNCKKTHKHRAKNTKYNLTPTQTSYTLKDIRNQYRLEKLSSALVFFLSSVEFCTSHTLSHPY